MNNNENNIKNEIIKNYFEFDLIKCEENFDLESYKKIDLREIASVGNNFLPIVDTIKNFFNGGQSGLYYVDTGGGTLFKCKSGIGHRGGLTTASGDIGQSVLYHIPFNPIQLGISLALSSISSKLDDNIRISREILDFLETDKESKLESAFELLNQSFNRYKITGTSSSSIEIVSNILKESNESKTFYKKRLNDELKTKPIDFLKIQHEFNCYSKSVYINSYSRFLLSILEEKLSPEDIELDKKEIDSIISDYEDIKNSILKLDKKYKNRHILSKLYEKFLQLDEHIEFYPPLKKHVADSAHKVHGFEDKFIANCEKENMLTTFNNSLEYLNVILNKSNRLCIDKENIYLMVKEEE